MIYNDHKNGIERDAHGIIVDKISQQDLNNALNLNKRTSKLSRPTAKQTRVPSASTDLRRKHTGKWYNVFFH